MMGLYVLGISGYITAVIASYLLDWVIGAGASDRAPTVDRQLLGEITLLRRRPPPAEGAGRGHRRWGLRGFGRTERWFVSLSTRR